MPTVLGTDLFDHAITAGYYTAGFVGTPQQDLTIVRSGDPASLLISSSVAEYVQINFSGTQRAWCAYAFRIESFPSTAVTVTHLSGATSGFSRIYVDESSRLDCWTFPTPANYPYISITTGAWYWVEVIADFTGTTFSTYWRVNLTGQAPTTGTTSNSAGGQTANAISGITIGMQSNDTVTYRVSRLMYGTAASTSDFLGEQFGAGQVLLPDADTDAGGWTTAPLYSKLNDGSDATYITATAS